MPEMFYYENLCSKQVGGYCTSNVILQKCVLKASGNLFFTSFSYFSNTKNVCSKQAGDCFLVYASTGPLLTANGGLLFGLFIINQYCTRNVLLRKLWKA